MQPENFELSKYMGKWYEIARSNYPGQQDIINSEANYKLFKDHVSVLNVGINKKNNKHYFWEASLTSYIPEYNIYLLTDKLGNSSVYEILYIDDNYQHAIVTNGEDLAWILSRNKYMDDKTYNYLLDIIEKNGYKVEKIS